MNYLEIYNNQTVNLSEIPEGNYLEFMEANLNLLADNTERHCVNYFGLKIENTVRLFCCIADDATHKIYVSSTQIDASAPVASLTAKNHNFEKFERELHENFGIPFTDHPWLKPMRYAHNRFDAQSTIANYPFYSIDSEELHEVGVGPIHAGVIEPGHFRFICNGEQILHLEIQLGYQHRGIEPLFLEKTKLLERATLAENITGDTTVGHAVAFANLWESLSDYKTDDALHFSRTLALEIERIAIHTGDMAAICGDMAYQLGNSVYGRLRTPMVNFLQEWCGNRLAKGLIRPSKLNYPFTTDLKKRLLDIFIAYERDFNEMSTQLFTLPSALSRMERTGIVTNAEAVEIGTVGMAARTSGLNRDIRASHPFNGFGTSIQHEPIIKSQGDVHARVQLRREEISQSIAYCKALIENLPEFKTPDPLTLQAGAKKFTLSLVEGWRGEICHCAITDANGNLILYKIKDPSHHNWMALAQAVRNNEISDFPLCNKSFNLSYSGHDL